MKCWIDIECPFDVEDYGKCFSCFIPNEKIEEKKNALPPCSVLESDFISFMEKD